MRHLERSHGVCISWMHEMFTRHYMYLAYEAKGPRLRVKPPLAVVTPFRSKWLRSTWFLRNGSWLKVEDRVDPGYSVSG